jgi:hypothetical protein
MNISKRSPTFHRALKAFDEGDVDLAHRSLAASSSHHTRTRCSNQERISYLWFFAWFAIYERRYDEAANQINKILHLETSYSSHDGARLAYCHLILSNVYAKQDKLTRSKIHMKRCLDLTEMKLDKTSWSYQALLKSLSDMERKSRDDIKSTTGKVMPFEKKGRPLNTSVGNVLVTFSD